MPETRSTQKRQHNHRSDSLNSNPGTSGTNSTNAKVHGNRGAQLNPNRIPKPKAHAQAIKAPQLDVAPKPKSEPMKAPKRG